jgi:hypothetical protein
VLTVRGVESFIFNGVSMTLAEVQDNIASPATTICMAARRRQAGRRRRRRHLTGGDGDDTYVIDNAGRGGGTSR